MVTHYFLQVLMILFMLSADILMFFSKCLQTHPIWHRFFWGITVALSNFFSKFEVNCYYNCCGKKSYITLKALTLQNGQIQSKNSSAICRWIVWVCLTILWGWCLKGYHNYFKLKMKLNANYVSLNLFKVNTSIIWKPVSWYAKQISWVISNAWWKRLP